MLFLLNFIQIQKVVIALGDYMGANCHACIGGTNVRSEAQKLHENVPHIVVGTPGRVFDMLSRRNLCKSFNKTFDKYIRKGNLVSTIVQHYFGYYYSHLICPPQVPPVHQQTW